MKNSIARMLISIGVISFLVAGTVHLVNAAEFFCVSGDVACLIASINTANNAKAEQHTIFLEPGTYTLTAVDNDTDGPNGLPSIKKTITIRQNDQGATVQRDPNLAPEVCGRGVVGCAPFFRLFHVATSGNLKLFGLGLTNGVSAGDRPLGGSAILNRGTLSLDRLAIYENWAAAAQFGGAIRNDGKATIVDTELVDNRSDFFQAPGGGAIGNNADLTIKRSLIKGNFGLSVGGIMNRGQLTIVDGAILDNISPFDGGGLFISDGTAVVRNTTIAGNRLTTGGGAAGINGSGGTLRLINSTVAENEAGALFNGVGGIFSFGNVEIANSIVAHNIVNDFNSDATFASDCDGTLTSLGNNIIGALDGCTINLRKTDFVGDPGIGELNGDHFPLLSDSRAIDNGNPNRCPNHDQEGQPRVGICDIGSIEFQGGRLPVSIDIRPKSDANKINPNSNKNINVAIFSANGFDTNAVDPNTVRFGVTEGEVAPIHIARRDVNGDGSHDLVMRFQIGALGIQCGATTATLTGQTTDGRSVVGSSPITTVQCKKPK